MFSNFKFSVYDMTVAAYLALNQSVLMKRDKITKIGLGCSQAPGPGPEGSFKAVGN
jgi:hypothetical protein